MTKQLQCESIDCQESENDANKVIVDYERTGTFFRLMVALAWHC